MYIINCTGDLSPASPANLLPLATNVSLMPRKKNQSTSEVKTWDVTFKKRNTLYRIVCKTLVSCPFIYMFFTYIVIYLTRKL